MKTTTTEVAEDIYRISTFVPDVAFQFNQFLIKDEQPLLYHTGMRALFPLVRAAVAEIIDPSTLKWIGFSHFEADECGALGEWLEVAPQAQPVCGLVSAMVSVNDQSSRPARPLGDGEVLETGKRRFRFLSTPHLPHGWDAGHLFEETGKSLFCSDLFHQMGDVEPATQSDLVGRYSATLNGMDDSPMAGYLPFGAHTAPAIARLAALAAKTILPMHGSTFEGDGQQALSDMSAMLTDLLG